MRLLLTSGGVTNPSIRAALDGMSAQMGAAGVDLGALEASVEEELAGEATEETADA